MLKPRISSRALRRERSKKCRVNCRSRTDLQTVTLRETPRGELTFSLPPSIAKVFGGKPGARVWFAVSGSSLVFSLRPWGPYPNGRRSSNKLRHVARPAGANARSCCHRHRHRQRRCAGEIA